MLIDFRLQSWRNANEKALRIFPKVTVCALRPVDTVLGFAHYRVEGSGGNKYLVAFWEDDREALNCSCECKAGERGFLCYHVAAAFNLHTAFIQNRVRPLPSKIKREASASLFFMLVKNFSVFAFCLSLRFAFPARLQFAALSPPNSAEKLPNFFLLRLFSACRARPRVRVV